MSRALSYPPSATEEAHDTAPSLDGRMETRYLSAFTNLDWEAYHRFRPLYPDSMFHVWLDYHQDQGSGVFQLAHDVGAGLGTVARRLVQYFEHMIVSDAREANIMAAKDILSTSRLSAEHVSKFTFDNFIPPSSIDFTSLAIPFHLVNAPDVIKSIAATLKPGATLAIVTYGLNLRFPDHPILKGLWYRVVSKESLRLIRGSLLPDAVRGLTTALSGLNYIPLPEELFKPGAKRIMVNIDESQERPLWFVHGDRLTWEPAPDRIGTSDYIEYINDPSWQRKADVSWLRGFLASAQMGFDQETWETDEWKELEDVVLSAGGVVTVEWPVAMILATRNNNSVIW